MRMAQCAPSFFAVSKKLPLLRLFVKVDYCIKYPGSGRLDANIIDEENLHSEAEMVKELSPHCSVA